MFGAETAAGTRQFSSTYVVHSTHPTEKFYMMVVNVKVQSLNPVWFMADGNINRTT